MNSAPGSASSEPHPARNTANALRPQKAEGDLARGRDARRGGAANRTTRTAERDIRGIGGPHTGLGCLTGPYGRCTQALNPRKESRIPHRQKPEKHCDIKDLSRGGWGGIRTHETLSRLPVFKTGAFNRSATHPCLVCRHFRKKEGALEHPPRPRLQSHRSPRRYSIVGKPLPFHPSYQESALPERPVEAFHQRLQQVIERTARARGDGRGQRLVARRRGGDDLLDPVVGRARRPRTPRN